MPVVLRIVLDPERRKELAAVAHRMELAVVHRTALEADRQMVLEAERRKEQELEEVPVLEPVHQMEHRKEPERRLAEERQKVVVVLLAHIDPVPEAARRREQVLPLAEAWRRMVEVQMALAVAFVAVLELASAFAVRRFRRPVWPFPARQDSWRTDRPLPNRLN